MKKQIYMMFSVLASAVVLVTAASCSRGAKAGGQSAAGSASDSTFTYAIPNDPGETCNVLTTSDRWGLSTVKMIYSPLYMNNADGINWFLATGYKTDDNLTYTFTLRNDVKWSDGQPFTADDVVFTYSEMEKEKNAGWAYSQLVYDSGAVTIKKIDDYTVSFTFPFKTPTAVEMLSQVFIMPEHIYENVTDYEHNDYNMKSVGTGPYKLVDYQTGSYLKFEANDLYFKGAPKIRNIVFKIIENSDTALLALQSGEVDAYQVLPGSMKKIDLAADNLEAFSYSEGRIGYLMINCARITNRNVRRALFFALNKDEMNRAAYLSADYYLTPYTFLPVDSEFYTDAVEKYSRSVETAKKLLQQEGVTNLTVRLGYIGTDDAQAKEALCIQEELKEAGITVQLQSADGTALSAAMRKPGNDYDMYLGGYIMGIDPDTFSSLFETGGAWNYMFYDDQKINSLFRKGRETSDTAERKAVYAGLQAEIQDLAAFYPIVSNNKILVVNKRIQGIKDARLVPVYTFEDASALYIAE